VKRRGKAKPAKQAKRPEKAAAVKAGIGGGGLFWTALRYAACVGVCLAVGAAGGLVTYPQIAAWYASLSKPFFSPPNWVFGPVWTILYIMMGVAVARVIGKGLRGKNVRAALPLFGLQLALNFLWSLAFFGLQSPASGVVVIAALWVALAATIWRFWAVSKGAALLLVPYLLWVSFASLLNIAVMLLN